MDWDKLRVFHTTAEAGSFTRAGEILNLSQSAVSRQIGALEESLHVTLFNRHARGLILTEQGEALYQTAREIVRKLGMTEALLSEGKTQPKGALKVTTTISFGLGWLMPRVNAFVAAYPSINLSVLMDDRELDLAMREADVAIRMQPPSQEGMIRRHLVSLKVNLCASESYLAEYGVPKDGAALKQHRLLGFPLGSFIPFPKANWLFDITDAAHDTQPRKLMYLSTTYAIAQAVEGGCGIAAIPDFLLADKPGIRRLKIPGLKEPEVDVYFVYPEEFRNSKRMAVFRDYLVTRVAENLG